MAALWAAICVAATACGNEREPEAGFKTRAQALSGPDGDCQHESFNGHEYWFCDDPGA